MFLLVLPSSVAGGRLLWEGNTSPRQPQWAPWVFPLATGITHGHRQPPLLVHPQAHPWQPTEPHAHSKPGGGRGWWCWGSPAGWGGQTPASFRPFSRLRDTAALGLLHKAQTLIPPGTGQCNELKNNQHHYPVTLSCSKGFKILCLVAYSIN